MLALGYLGFGQYRLQQSAQALDEAAADFEARRVERPVLRGSPVDDNAAAQVLAAVAGLPALTERRRGVLADALFYGTELPDDAVSEAERGPLTALRMASQSSWTMTQLDVSKGLSVHVPDYPKVIDAALLMLAEGRAGGPAACMVTAADVVRMGQDLVPGGPLEASSVSARLTAIAMPVLARCSTEADEDALMEALRSLRALHEHAPSIVPALQLRRLLLASEVVKRNAERSGQAFAWLSGSAERTQEREAVDRLIEPNPRLLDAGPYPELVDAVRLEQQRQQQLGIASDPALADEILGFVYDDMRGAALLRAGVIGLSTVVWYVRHDHLPREPVGVHDPELLDPFTGRALYYRFNEVEHTLVLWSTGEDRRDGGGNTAWSSDAPRDVVLRFPIKPKQVPTRHGARRSR